MKSLITLTIHVLRDSGALCGVDVTRDEETIARRVNTEGVSFLTITLPTFADALEQGLSTGRWSQSPCPSFKRAGALPRFLRGFTDLVFASDGRLKMDRSSDAVYAVRQVCRLHKKVFAVPEERYVDESINRYVECAQSMGEYWYKPDTLRALGVTCCRIFGDHLARIESRLAEGHAIPKHGPGATADRLLGNQKYDSLYWTERLEDVASFQDFILPIRDESSCAGVRIVPPGAEIPLRVVPVPKTANKARVIAMEPANVQYAQQALMAEFMREFSDGTLFVDLSDQGPNQEMARRGSKEGHLVTIDLSEASDRVGLGLVEGVFSRFPLLLGWLKATRSMTADVPGHGIQPVSAFASMGSATCFPVESIVFATIVLHAVACSRYRTVAPSRAELIALRDEVRVFGDDIIAPKAEAPDCLRLLVECGARPNGAKTFLDGPFRESCGKDWCDGDDVTVVYRRSDPPRTVRDARELVSWVSMRNQFYEAGLWGTVRYLDEKLGAIVPLPLVGKNSPALGRTSVFGFEVHRWHPDHQSPLVRAFGVEAKAPPSRITGEGALLKCTLPHLTDESAGLEREHLVRCGRPRDLRMKSRWYPAA